MTEGMLRLRVVGLDDTALIAILLEYGAFQAACLLDDLQEGEGLEIKKSIHPPDVAHAAPYQVLVVPFNRTNPAAHIYLRKFSDQIRFADDPEE